MKIFILSFITLLALFIEGQATILRQYSDSCNNFDGENACRGNQTDNADDWKKRNFQTPPRGDPLWHPQYQDYDKLVGYARIQYNSAKSSSNVTVYTQINDKHTGVNLIYSFNGINQSSNVLSVDSSQKQLLNITVYATKNGSPFATLVLDSIDFIWNHPVVNQPDNFKNGQKGAIVQMFGWPYADIEQQCPMIAKAGYLGVKVFPPQQSIMNYEGTQNGQLNPWYFLYQPTSYRLHSRMGNADALRKMINTCRSVGVRVYADAVVNHMAGNGNDAFPYPNHCSGSVYWGAKNSSGFSPYYTQGFAYDVWNFTGERPGMQFPSVPYGPLDFHCARSLNSWTDGFVLNYGWLVNLADLNTEKQYVRQRIADYFTELLSIGFSGFRIDAAKHISPGNLAAIFALFKANLGGTIPDDWITYLEVIIGGEKDLLMCQDNPYNYGQSFANLMRSAGLSEQDINKVKIWQSDYPKQFPLCGWPIPSERYVAQLDCHDDQFPGSSSRDMGDSGTVLVKQKNVDKHRNDNIRLLTRTDGNWQIKLILSSYTFLQSKSAYSFPDGKSDCTKCATSACRTSCTKSMPYSKASQSDVCGYTCIQNGSWKEAVYTRVHRDYKIIRALRQWMGLSTNITPNDVGLPSICS